jgi:hypothetical protein
VHLCICLTTTNWYNGAQSFVRSHRLRSYSRILQNFMEPESSLPYSQEPSAGTNLELVQCCPYNPTLILLDSFKYRSLSSSVGIATGYGLDGRGVGVRVPRISSSPNRPDRPWGPLNLLSNGYRELSPRSKAAGA